MRNKHTELKSMSLKNTKIMFWDSKARTYWLMLLSMITEISFETTDNEETSTW